jgi:hypothetical protein
MDCPVCDVECNKFGVAFKPLFRCPNDHYCNDMLLGYITFTYRYDFRNNHNRIVYFYYNQDENFPADSAYPEHLKYVKYLWNNRPTLVMVKK